MIIFITRFATSLPSYNLIPLFNLLGNTICGWCCGHTIHVTAARSQYLHLECYGPAALCVTCAYWKLILAGQLISGLQQQQHKNKIKKYFKVTKNIWEFSTVGTWDGEAGAPEAGVGVGEDVGVVEPDRGCVRRPRGGGQQHHLGIITIIYYLLFLLSITYYIYYLLSLLSIYLSPRQPRHGDLGRQVAVQRVQVQRWSIRVSVEVTWPVSTNHSSPDHSQ